MWSAKAALRIAAPLLLSVVAGQALAEQASTKSSKSAETVEARKRAKAERELEALLLQTLVSTAYARKDSGLFGGGAAGRQWQAMMSEHVARAVAASDQVRLLPSGRHKSVGQFPAPARPSQPVASEARQASSWVTVANPEPRHGPTLGNSSKPQIENLER